MSEYGPILKEALGAAYDGGYSRGRVDALKAMSISLNTVYALGIIDTKDRKGYKMALDTIDETLKFLQQDNEEKGH